MSADVYRRWSRAPRIASFWRLRIDRLKDSRFGAVKQKMLRMTTRLQRQDKFAKDSVPEK